MIKKGSKYVGLWFKGHKHGHGELIHKNHKLVSKFKEGHVCLKLFIISFKFNSILMNIFLSQKETVNMCLTSELNN